MKIIVCLFAVVALCQAAPPSKLRVKSIEQLRSELDHVQPVEEFIPSPVVERRTKIVEIDEEDIARKQAENAKYEYNSAIEDGINGHTHYRTEKRDGLDVEGSYSYSDGFWRRTVSYIADKNGFRIVSEEVEPIGNGPVVNPNGVARVHTSDGTNYEITMKDIVHRKA